MDWIAYTKQIGPFSAPLCVFMGVFGGAVVRWLLKERSRLLVELKTQAADATGLREKRIDDREAAALEYKESNRVFIEALTRFDLTSKAVLEAVRG